MTWRIATRNLLASKLRLFLVSLAIVSGVAFVVGAFVLGDTISRAFDDVFATANKGVAVQVRGVATVSDLDRQPVPASVLPAVARVDGVAAAEGTVAGIAQVLKKDGTPAGLSGPPALGFSWSDTPGLNPLRILSGRAPRADDEVVIDTTTVKRAKFALGDRVQIVTASGPGTYRLVGITGFGAQNNLAGATLTAFTLATAQRVMDSRDRFVQIDVTAKPGVTDTVLRDRVKAVLPTGYEAVTGETAAQEQSRQFKTFVDIFRNFLLAFAGIALFVGSFIIFNAFKITVAQRTRQVGLLRAVGASSGQIVRSVMIEAFLTGVIASIIGILAGILMALGLRALFNALGAALPSTSLQVEPRSIIAGFLVGILVTLAGALGPAWRTSRVPPIAALRDTEVHGSPRIRAVLAGLLTTVGVLLVLAGMLAPSGGLAQRFSMIGLGAMLLFIGAAMLTQYVVRPLARLIGAPMSRLGLAGRLGRENAARNPSRTAQTAAALTIGVALVTGVTVFAASLRETFVGTLDSRVRADLVILSSSQQPFSAAASSRLQGLPELSASTAWRDGQFKDPDGDVQSTGGVNPALIGQMYDAGVEQGSFADLAAPGTVAVNRAYAKEHHLKVGSTFRMLFARTGTKPMRVAAVFKDTTFGDFYVSLAEFERDFSNTQDSVVLARAANGVSPERARDAATAALKPFGDLKVRTKSEYREFVSSQIGQFLNLFYMLLGMAVLIAVFGIVLTLALSVFERTREIGLLRAVGLSRRSVKAMIRWEGVIVCLIGAVVGVGLGVFLGVVSVSAIPDFTATVVPWGRLVWFLVVAGVLGVLAASLPARRASRLNILEAIQNE